MKEYRLFKHQLELITNDKPIVYMVAGRGSGKSYAASCLIIKYFLEGKRVIALAQTFQALTEVLFAEIFNRLNELGITEYVFHRQGMKIEFGSGVIYGASYQNIEAIRGLSCISLAVCDEAALSPSNLFAVLAPCLRGDGIEPRIRMMSTPRRGSWLDFYCKQNPEKVHLIHARTRDNKFVTEEQIELMKSAISNPELLEQELNGVMLDEDTKFHVVKWSDYPLVCQMQRGQRRLGGDLSGAGNDYSCFVVVDDTQILDCVKLQHSDTFEESNAVQDLVRKWGVQSVKLDAGGGYSKGLVDVLKQSLRIPIIPVNFAGKSPEDGYANNRAYMYMNLGDKIRSGFFIDSEEVKEELQYTTFDTNNSGKTIIRPKEEIKEILHHSPDMTDALALALAEFPEEQMALSPSDSLMTALRFASF